MKKTLVGLAFALLLAVQAWAQNPLFKKAPDYVPEVRTEDKAYVTRTEYVTVKDLSKLKVGRALVLNPFDKRVEFEAKQIEPAGKNGGQFFFGESEKEFGLFNFLQASDGLTGYISLADFLYRIEPVGGGVHRASEIDRALFIKEETEPDYPQETVSTTGRAHPATQEVTRTATSQIDVLVAYTDDVAALYSQQTIQNEINLAISMGNNTYSNSGVNINLNLVHTVQVDFYESGYVALDVENFANMTSVQTLRNYYGADVCALILSQANMQGRAMAIYALESQAYCVAQYDYAASDWTLAHEIGHLIGARHQWPESQVGQYEHGHFVKGGFYPFRTVMAMYRQFAYDGPRIPWYSDPAVTYHNQSLGVRDTAEVARYLIEYGARLTAFRNPAPVVRLWGPTSLYPNQTGTWSCGILQQGQPPYHYQWYFRYPEDPLRTGDTRKPPAGWWVSFGSDLSTASRSDDESFDLKCQVTDAYQRVVETPIFSVTVGGMAKPRVQALDDVLLPEKTALYDGYPNPFNPATTIPYDLQEAEYVRLSIYDASGRCVKRLVDRRQGPGSYKTVFHAEDLASGLYFCELTAGRYHAVRKLLLLK